MSLDATLGALAEPTRRQVVEALCRGPLRASQIARRCGMSRPAMSRHLRVLRETGLVTERRDPDDGRARIYELVPGPIADLGAWAREVESFWTEQLASFARHLEAE